MAIQRQKTVELTDVLVSLMEKSGESWSFEVHGYDFPLTNEHYFEVAKFKIGDRPGWEEVQAEYALLQAQAEAEAYRYARAEEYPNLADQLDMLWHAIDQGTLDQSSTFYQTIKAIKENNPKS